MSLVSSPLRLRPSRYIEGLYNNDSSKFFQGLRNRYPRGDSSLCIIFLHQNGDNDNKAIKAYGSLRQNTSLRASVIQDIQFQTLRWASWNELSTMRGNDRGGPSYQVCAVGEAGPCLQHPPDRVHVNTA